MQSDQIRTNSFFSLRNAAFATLLVLFVAFVVMAFPHALSGNADNIDCINESVECVAQKDMRPNLLIWLGVFLCSLAGLILMTFKSTDQKKAPTIYIGIASAAALNTIMWMAIVYAGAFLINLF